MTLINYIIVLIVIFLGYMIYKNQESLSDRKAPNPDLYQEEDYSYLDDIFDQMKHKKGNIVNNVVNN